MPAPIDPPALTFGAACLLLALPGAALAQTSTSTPSALSSTTSAELAPEPSLGLEALLDTGFVKSASLRRQSRYESPASITVITHDEIIDSGALDVTEVLRRVVGVQVIGESANVSSVGVRGFTGALSNRVAVYLDGRSLADIAYGYVQWSSLPLNPEEIERIEVIRGPGSTLYGANAVGGVINIVSRRPLAHPGLDASGAGTLAGLSGTRGAGPRSDLASLAGGGQSYLAYSWANAERSLGVRTSFGFSRSPEWVRGVGAAQHGDFDYHARVAVEAQPTETLKLFGAVDHTAGESILVTPGNSYPVRIYDGAEALLFDLEQRQLFGAPLVLTLKLWGRRDHAGSDSQKYLEYESGCSAQLDWTAFEERNTLTLLTEVRRLAVQHFFESSPSATSFGVALQDEVLLLSDRSLVLNMGLRVDAVRSEDHDDPEAIQYRNLSPRAALVYHPAERQAVRFAASTAYRTPSVFQTFVDVTFDLPNGPPVALLSSNPRLEPETILSAELGYLGALREDLELEAVLFVQHISEVVENRYELRLPIEVVNTGAKQQVGLETALQYRPTPEIDLALRYGHLESFDGDTGDRERVFPRHLFGLSSGFSFAGNMRISADFNFVSGMTVRSVESRPDLMGLYLPILKAREQYLLDVQCARKIFDGAGEVFVGGRNIVGFFRPPALAEQSYDTAAQPIGGTLIVGLRAFGL